MSAEAGIKTVVAKRRAVGPMQNEGYVELYVSRYIGSSLGPRGYFSACIVFWSVGDRKKWPLIKPTQLQAGAGGG